MHSTPESNPVVQISSRKFLIGCAIAAAALLIAARFVAFPVALLAAEVFATILGLFLFGSFRYQIHKNALTYGMALVIIATFFGIWWPSAGLRAKVASDGWGALAPFAQRHFLSWEGLDHLIHADTMMFILGLTLFVAVIAHTRLLEGIVFFLLKRYHGGVLLTAVSVTAAVSFASGILDGVSMIGLTIRTLVVILFLARAPIRSVRIAVMLCTIVTTVCGMWLAYGEPPNLIMKANLRSPSGEFYLTDGFFLRYCLPSAIATYLVVAWNLRRHFKGLRVDLPSLDILDANIGSVLYLQAMRHGKVLTPIELLESRETEIGEAISERVQSRVQAGETLGLAMVREGIPEKLRHSLLGEYVIEELAEDLDLHYTALAAGDAAGARGYEHGIGERLKSLTAGKKRAQRIGLTGMAVFVCFLIGHAIEHRIPLFVSSFAGFFVSLLAIWRQPRMRRLALHEAREEFAEYYFLFPLFLSIALLTKAGFFEKLQELVRAGIDNIGHGHVAFLQFIAATFLSATLDNNVVADFGSRAILNLELAVLHLFSMAQIAGYALGGCWTHIGSAQSVVAFSFIRRDIDEHYTPIQWVREMTWPILQAGVVLAAIIYAESALLRFLE